MRTVVLGDRPVELEELLARRRALGQDGHDEVWEGEYHVAPHAHSDHGLIDRRLALLLEPWAQRAGLMGTGAFNLGAPEDFRVPDGGFHRTRPGSVYVASAPVVVEIVSPDDETFAKFGFYAAHGVLEVLVALPEEREVRCYDPSTGAQLAVSRVLGMDLQELSAELAWPA
jgi:Uma2 family endonuclease